MFGGRLSRCGREQVESGILRVSEGWGPFCGYLSPSAGQRSGFSGGG